MNYRTKLLHWLFLLSAFVPAKGIAGEHSPPIVQQIEQLTVEARYAENRGDFATAAQIYNRLLEKSEASNYRKGKMNWYLGMTFIYSQLRNTARTGELAAGFLRWAKEKNETTELAYAFYANGMYYRGKMQFDSSFYFLDETARLLNKINDPYLEAKVYGAFSYNYQKIEMAGEAIEYGNKAFALHKQMNDTPGMAKTLTLMAPAFNYKNDTTNWYGHCNEGLRLAKLSGNVMLQMLASNNIAYALFKINKNDSAEYYLNDALRLAQEHQFIFDRNDYAISLANYYSLEGNYEKAMQLLNRVYADTARYPLAKQKLHLAQIIHYDVLKSRGRLAEANAMLEQYLELNEEIYQDNLAVKGFAASYQLKHSEKAKQLTSKQLQVKKQNMLILAMGMGLLALTFLALYLKKKQLAGKQLLEAAKREKELAAIKAQLSGQLNERHRLSREIHDDLGSSLTALGLLTETLRKQPGYEQNPVVEKISASTLLILKQMNDILWSVNSFNDTTTSLLAHINRFTSEFLQQSGITFHVTDHTTGADYPINSIARRNIYLVVKEAVHNAIKHSGCTAVSLEMNTTSELLHITITDNGKGFMRENITGNGMGLNNMNERMREIGGSLQISTTAGQTGVEILYPLAETG